MELFGAGLAGLTTTPSSAVAILDDHYVNRKLGIAFRKPHDWFFADIKEMGAVKAGQILDLDDRKLARDLVASAELPILTISREQLSAAASQFTPGITIFLDGFESMDVLPDEVRFDVPMLDNLVADIDSCASILKGFRVTCPPRSLRISNCDTAEYYATFIFEHVNMRPTPVRMRTLAIFQKPGFYTLRMYDSPQSSNEQTYDYSSFVDSITML